MKKLFVMSLSLIFTLVTFGQTEEDINLVQSLWGKEKREMISEVLDIPSGQETTFWEEYSVYESKRKALGKERIAILSQYADQYGKFTDDNIADLINKGIKNNMDLQKLYKKTYKSMAKSVSPKTAAHFIQLENYIMTAIQLEIQESIPFIGEIKVE